MVRNTQFYHHILVIGILNQNTVCTRCTLSPKRSPSFVNIIIKIRAYGNFDMIKEVMFNQSEDFNTCPKTGVCDRVVGGGGRRSSRIFSTYPYQGISHLVTVLKKE